MNPPLTVTVGVIAALALGACGGGGAPRRTVATPGATSPAAVATTGAASTTTTIADTTTVTAPSSGPTNPRTAPGANGDPAVVAAAFAKAYLTASWSEPLAAHATRCQPWATSPATKAIRAADASLSPTLRQALHQTVTATVRNVTLADRPGAGQLGYTVSATTTTITNGGPPTSGQRSLQLLEQQQPDGTWRVASVIS
jgi:hypothetical protein